MMRCKWTALLAATLALGAGAAVSLASDSLHGRYDNDVCVKLSLRDRKSGNPLARVRVRNQGRNDQAGILVELRAQTEAGEILSSWIVDLRSRRSWSRRLRVTPPEGTTVLVATTTLSGAADEHPDDDIARALCGTAGTPVGAPLGASIYAANCASCHGTLAEGTASGPAVTGKDAEDIGEAVRGEEEEMPAFPALSAADLRALAAWLKNPVPVEQPPPPPPPPRAPPRPTPDT